MNPKPYSNPKTLPSSSQKASGLPDASRNHLGSEGGTLGWGLGLRSLWSCSRSRNNVKRNLDNHDMYGTEKKQNCHKHDRQYYHQHPPHHHGLRRRCRCSWKYDNNTYYFHDGMRGNQHAQDLPKILCSPQSSMLLAQHDSRDGKLKRVVQCQCL